MSSNVAPVEEPTMSFLDHLDELRRRLTYAAIAVAISFCICFSFSDRIYGFLDKPVREALKKARTFQMENKIPIHPIGDLPENATFNYVFSTETNLQGVSIPAGTTIPARFNKTEKGRMVVAAIPL